MTNFVDIHSKLRSKSDIFWTIRSIDFSKTSQHSLSHEELKTYILESDVVRAIEDLEREENSTDKSRTRNKIRAILDEVGYTKSTATIRLLSYLLVKIMRKTLTGIYVNEARLLELKDSMKNVPVVLVPTHRSYSDFVLMAFLCFFHGVEIPCVAAGVGFLSMSVVGEMLRKTKAFFMRRTFQDDEFYKTVFARYVSSLLTHGNSPVEFFIEGTRSRTGKNLTPKYGFLNMVLEPYLNGRVPDIHLIPVSITYDRLVEERLLTRELLGSPKPEESTKSLLKSYSILNGNYGNVYMNFGDTISARDWICRNGRADYQQHFDVKKLALHIIESHGKLQVLGSTHLIMAIVYHSLILFNRTVINVDIVRRNLNVLLSALDILGANVCFKNGLDQEISFVCSVHSTLISLKENHLHFHGRKRNDELLDISLSVLLILYVNPVASSLFRPAILLLLIVQNRLLDNDVHKKLNFLCELYEYEFPIAHCTSDQKFTISREFLVDTMCIIDVEGRYSLSSNCTVIELLYSIILPYLRGYALLCQFFFQSSANFRYTNKSLTLLCAQHLSSLYSRRILDFPFCLTLSFSSNCVAGLKKIGCLCRVEGEKGKEMVSVVHDKIEMLSSLLNSLISNPLKKTIWKSRL